MTAVAQIGHKHSAAPNRLAAAGLVALMVLGSLMLWIGNPAIWLWLGSRLQSSTQPSLGPYVAVFVGLVISSVATFLLLARLNATYGRVTHTTPAVRVRLPWHRGLRSENEGRVPVSVLDVVMAISVGTALIAFAIWFLFFAGSSLPV